MFSGGLPPLKLLMEFLHNTDKTITPKSVSDVKLIHAGKILENNKTLADSRITVGNLPSGVTTMHVVIQPPVAKKKTGLFSFLFFIYVNHSLFMMHSFLGIWKFCHS